MYEKSSPRVDADPSEVCDLRGELVNAGKIGVDTPRGREAIRATYDRMGKYVVALGKRLKAAETDIE